MAMKQTCTNTDKEWQITQYSNFVQYFINTSNAIWKKIVSTIKMVWYCFEAKAIFFLKFKTDIGMAYAATLDVMKRYKWNQKVDMTSTLSGFSAICHYLRDVQCGI